MAKKISTALVIATYNWPEALKLVLESVLQQQVLPDEVIIADDGSGSATKQLIDTYKETFPVPLKHFWHEDNGFQKTLILNLAIAGTTCDYIIQVDGDIILDKNFVKDHIRAAEKGYYIRGSRVLLSESKSHRELAKGKFQQFSIFSQDIKNRINALRIPFLAPLFIKKSKRSDNVSGCNCAFWHADFAKVNGYNHDIKGWGHEDIELAARFVNLGLSQKKIKMMAVCYHLHHPYHDRKRETLNYTIYKNTLTQGIWYCSKGYRSYQQQYG
ncbi:glycosyltransferase family 2 protein [Spirosoma sp. KNUC1025]|uniref:glycosyltransferase family 2 protein n=1 Tax=Spirosoma sp. KNUC1025 TaxID=2894082 RepID=UPI0038691761|nr:glycosyltransferase family 2 protein [Spirosoma sp. KNUC1025]